MEDMKEIGSPKLLFENQDLTPIHPTLWKGLHAEGPGRPVEYDLEWDLKALMLLQIPYMKDLVKRLRRNPHLRNLCGYGDRTPTEAHFTQAKKRIGAEGFRVIEAWLRREALRLRDSQPLTAVGLVRGVKPSLRPGGRLAIVERDPAKSGRSWYGDSLRERRRHEAVSREGILGDAEEAGYNLVETHTFLPEDNIYILRRRH